MTRTIALVLALFATPAFSQSDRPAVGPERPFQLAPRVERTLPNGLRDTPAASEPPMPKTCLRISLLTADVGQEGTKTRTSKEIRRQVFGMGGSLTAGVSQDYSSLSV